MSSLDMALDSILWLKEEKRCFLHCTEYGYEWRADAIGYNGKDLIEIEVKTSWTDFQADFRNKKKKHQVLLDAYLDQKAFLKYNYVPNYMYFLVTKSVLIQAKRYLEKNKLPYGLMLYHPPSNGRGRGGLESIKKVKRIHSNKPNDRILNVMMARMGSEYIYGFVDMKSRIKEELDTVFCNFFKNTNLKSIEITSKSISEIIK